MDGLHAIGKLLSIPASARPRRGAKPFIFCGNIQAPISGAETKGGAHPYPPFLFIPFIVVVVVIIIVILAAKRFEAVVEGQHCLSLAFFGAGGLPPRGEVDVA